MKLTIAGRNLQTGKPYFDHSEICRFIAKLENDGYEPEILDEGCLGMGTIIMWSPEPERRYSFLIREIYLNCWSSGHTIQRFSKVTKKLQAEIDAARARMESESV